MLHTFTVQGEAAPKPRMTRADVWKKRPIVLRFREWADKCRYACTGKQFEKVDAEKEGIVGIRATFHFPVPDSETKKAKASLYGSLHKRKPDLDNCVKAITDALFIDDNCISVICAEKYYVKDGSHPKCEITMIKGDSLYNFGLDCSNSNVNNT